MTSPNLIQTTNIENILETHLWDEIEGVEDKIRKLLDQVDELTKRKDKLVAIAKAAEIHHPLSL